MLKPETCLEILKDFKSYADKHNVTWFLLFGTCLGAIRDKDFIKDDKDIDIGVYGDDLNIEKLLDDMRKNKQNKYYSYKGLPIRCELLYKTSLDINPLYLINNKYYYIKRIQNNRVYGKEYSKEFFDTLDEINFKGLKVKVPHNTEKYLTYLYNDWRVKKPQGTSNLRELVEVKI